METKSYIIDAFVTRDNTFWGSLTTTIKRPMDGWECLPGHAPYNAYCMFWGRRDQTKINLKQVPYTKRHRTLHVKHRDGFLSVNGVTPLHPQNDAVLFDQMRATIPVWYPEFMDRLDEMMIMFLLKES
jgi:hypothetical protein